MAILESSAAATAIEAPPRLPIVDEEWLVARREQATAGIAETGRPGYMEALAALLPKGSVMRVLVGC